MIAGLETVTEGEIHLDGRLINTVRPGDRDMAMVFQNYALYAHMSVADNLGYSLRIRKVPKADRQAAVKSVAESLHIAQLLDRKPRHLSGGERQRVALGRAIIRNPKVFLMDEPLSNLDALLRVQMRTEILKLQREMRSTTVYVTHDQVEAMSMADKLVLLHDGLVEQIGTPRDIYERPVNRYVASFVGTPGMNFIEPGTLQQDDGHLYFACSAFRAELPGAVGAHLSKQRPPAGTSVVLGIRPENVGVAGAHPEWREHTPVKAQVRLTQNLGSHMLAFTDMGDQSITAMADPSIALHEGEVMTLELDMGRAHLFEAASGRSLTSGV
jgi:multiple sugar transport system ATP-binding protein